MSGRGWAGYCLAACVQVLAAEDSSTWGLLGLEMLSAFVADPGCIPPGPQEGPGQAEGLILQNLC